VLDIGGEVGALVVLLAAPPVGGELFACPQGRPEAHFHTGVHSRDIEGTPTWVALYPEVVEGNYDLLDGAGSPMAQVAIIGGEVGQVDLRPATQLMVSYNQ
jgi:hypothetical protein